MCEYNFHLATHANWKWTLKKPTTIPTESKKDPAELGTIKDIGENAANPTNNNSSEAEGTTTSPGPDHRYFLPFATARKNGLKSIRSHAVAGKFDSKI